MVSVTFAWQSPRIYVEAVNDETGESFIVPGSNGSDWLLSWPKPSGLT